MRNRGEAGVKRLWFPSQTAVWPSNCLPTLPSRPTSCSSQSAAVFLARSSRPRPSCLAAPAPR